MPVHPPESTVGPNARAADGDAVLLVRRCDILNDSGLVSVSVSLLVAGLLVHALYDPQVQSRQLGWLVCMVLLTVLRVLAWQGWRRRRAPGHAPVHGFLLGYRALVTLSGTMWGITPWLLLQPGPDLSRQVILAFAIAGISAGGITALAVDLVCVLGFLLPAVLPLIGRFLLAAEGVREAMGLMSLLYLGFMVANAVRVGRGLLDNLRLEREAELREQVLRESEDRLKRAQQVAQLGSFDRDLVSGQARWSDEHYRLWGLTPSAGPVTRALFREGVHPGDRERVIAVVADAGRLGRGYDLTHRVLRPDGSVIEVRQRAEVVLGTDGRPVRIIGTVQDITATRLAEERIRHLAYYDPLTALPNRHLLLERLQDTLDPALGAAGHGALFFIDLDNFKYLNDTYGHDQGDRLLGMVAGRILACVRPGDLVARLGGDEFVVLLPQLGSDVAAAAAPARQIAEAILGALAAPYALPMCEYHSSASLGVALFAAGLTNAEDLMKCADLAMYQAKAAGRGTLCFFTPEMQARATERAALEVDLRTAVQEGGFELWFQRQVNGAGECTGAEALLRWPHARRGMVPPNDFIPIAEESGLILPIGQWVLERACAQLVEWSTEPALQHLTLAVNVSARQFRQADFVAQVREALARSGANPARLKLELTESLLLADVEEAIHKMDQLRASGVGFALDDFGIGYSSLSYLKRLPLDLLKIDKTFVQDVLDDPNDAAFAQLILALGRSLGLQVIAEGVETEGQRTFLAACGCHGFQGYLFGRPMTAPEFEARILERPRVRRAAAG